MPRASKVPPWAMPNALPSTGSIIPSRTPIPLDSSVPLSKLERLPTEVLLEIVKYIEEEAIPPWVSTSKLASSSRFLYAVLSPEIYHKHGNDMLAVAITRGHSAGVLAALAWGVSVNGSPRVDKATPSNLPCAIRDLPPLLEALCQKDDGIPLLLLERGANQMITYPYTKSSTPLHAAALQGWSRCVEALIARGANVNERDESDMTPLHYATQIAHVYPSCLSCRPAWKRHNCGKTWAPIGCLLLIGRGHVETIRRLIRGGADVEARDCHGWTPADYLHRASWNAYDLYEHEGPDFIGEFPEPHFELYVGHLKADLQRKLKWYDERCRTRKYEAHWAEKTIGRLLHKTAASKGIRHWDIAGFFDEQTA